jgi:transmembrane sensor
MALSTFRHVSVPPEAVDDAAAYWLARRGLGSFTPQEDASFRQWLQNPAAAAAFEDAERAMSLADDLSAISEIRRMREAALTKAPPRTARSLSWRPFAAAAAVIAAAILLVSHVYEAGGEPRVGASADRTALSVTGARRYATAVGQRREVTLDDGSVVTLNTHSAIEVSYSARRRNVQLLRGQALFQVAHHQKDRPFVVTAGAQRVTATGTAFDVRLEGEDVKVVLLEGHVIVAPIARDGLRQILPVLGQQPLSAGEQLVAPAAGPVRVSVADIATLTSWRYGQLVFRDERLASAIAEINRYSTTQLVVENPQVADLKISGVFNVAGGNNFVAALTAYYPLTAHRRSETLMEIAWKPATSTSR